MLLFAISDNNSFIFVFASFFVEVKLITLPLLQLNEGSKENYKRRLTMSKCENCYHYGFYCIKNYGNCNHYKDKSLIVELPCKVGDEVYRISTKYRTKRKYIQGTRISRIAIDVDGIWLFCECNLIAKCVFGKTVFLTREEAEKALKERESNDAK